MKDLTERIGSTLVGLIVVPIILLNVYDGCVDKHVYFPKAEKFTQMISKEEIAEIIMVPENFFLMKDSKKISEATIFQLDGQGYHKFGPLFKKDNALFGISFHNGVKKKINLEMRMVGSIKSDQISVNENEADVIRTKYYRTEDGIVLDNIVFWSTPLSPDDKEIVNVFLDFLEE